MECGHRKVSFKIYVWDDFFSQVPVNTGYEKYFRFECLRKLYKFVAMSNGYSDPMRIFTYLNI